MSEQFGRGRSSTRSEAQGLSPPLVYTTRSDVTLQRPDKLRVISPGDGPASEFYYDGKTMVAFMPAENLVAVAAAPPAIDAVLEAAYHSAAIYFPFADVMVADPYGDIAKSLELAFYIGQPAWSAGPRPTWWPTRAAAYSCRCGSARRTSCRGWPARSSATIRCGCVTRWSSPTGSYKAQTLSAFLGTAAPKAAPAIDFITPLTPEAEKSSPQFFNTLNFVLQFCPTNPSETDLMARFARIGVSAGKTLDASYS